MIIDIYIILYSLHSLKRTGLPLKIGRAPKGNVVFQPLIFRAEHVCFREGIFFSDIFVGFNMTYPSNEREQMSRCACHVPSTSKVKGDPQNLGDISNSSIS